MFGYEHSHLLSHIGLASIIVVLSTERICALILTDACASAMLHSAMCAAVHLLVGSLGLKENKMCISRVGMRIWHFLIWLLGMGLLAGCAASSSGPSWATQAVTVATEAVPVTTLPPTPTAPAALTLTPARTITPAASATSAPTATATRLPTVTPTAGPTPDGVSRTLRVPILMYHYLSDPPADADIYRRDLSVAPARFESHLQYLAEAGYQTITLDDLLYALAQGRMLPEKPVILTFDDGYEDNYTNAFPILRQHGAVAHFFIVTDFINQGRTGYLTWPEIEEMAAAGQRFGSHSRDHPDLRAQSVDYLVWQALGSKESIEEHLGYHPRWIAYPSGGYDSQAIAVFESADYWGGLTTQQGATHTLDGIFTLRRVRVRGSHTAQDLAALLALEW